MTRKHFAMTAAAIAAIENPAIRRQQAEEAAKVFAASNPRFDRERFFAACNVKG